jgi:RNA polymerase sigma-70 factor (ECF subfamily)
MSAPPPDSNAALVQLGLKEYESALVGYAMNILQDLESARDAVQDTFLKLFQQPPGKVGLASLKAWLFTVCRNRCLDTLRKRKRLVSLEDLPAYEDFSAEEPSPDENAVKRSQADRVQLFLGRLSENQREVLRLKFQADLSYKEISEATGLSESNVGFLIHAAIKRLRGFLTYPDPALP